MKQMRAWVLVLLAACVSDAKEPVADACSKSKGAYVAVHAKAHELLLCDGGAVVERFDVRLAKNGLDKHVEGDGKLPLGTYTLADAVPSERFGRFLLVGYPTPAQRARG